LRLVMKPRLRLRWSLLPVLALCAACAGAPSRHPKTGLDLLRQRAPGVEWNEQSLLEADLDQDGRADYALLGTARDKVVVGVVHGSGRWSSP
jgi:hypothetical protein